MNSLFKISVGKTIYSVLKYDSDRDVALLKNDNGTFYNVARGITANGWDGSIGYTEDYLEADYLYFKETSVGEVYDIFFDMYNLYDAAINFNDKINIVQLAQFLYLKSNDERGSRITVNDLSEFLIQMYISNGYLNKNIPFEDTPIYKMDKFELLKKFINNDTSI